MGYKPTVRQSLLAGCALFLLTPACATTKSKTAAPGPKQAKAAKVTEAIPPSLDKSASKSSAPGKPSKAAEAKKPTAPPEPDLPAHLPEALHCPIPSEVQPETDVTIRCAVKPGLGTRSVIVRYRPSGSESYITADAARSPKGWYVLKIRGSEIKGSSLQLFVEAYGAGNKVIASNGTDESPNIVLIQKRGGAGPALEEDPLAHIQREQAAEAAQNFDGRRRPAPALWLGLGIGSGYGWFPTRTPEGWPGARVSGFATGAWFHLLPEVGYQWTDHIAFSAQFRYQFVQTSTQGGAPPYPHDRAYAGLGNAYLMTDALFGRQSNFQLFGMGTVGGGTAFRLYVAPSPSANSNIDFRNSSTVYGGPLVVGAGGGVMYHLTNYLAFAGQLRALGGFPRSALMVEAGVSVQVGLWTAGAFRPAGSAAPAPLLEPEPEYNPGE